MFNKKNIYIYIYLTPFTLSAVSSPGCILAVMSPPPTAPPAPRKWGVSAELLRVFTRSSLLASSCSEGSTVPGTELLGCPTESSCGGRGGETVDGGGRWGEGEWERKVRVRVKEEKERKRGVREKKSERIKEE